MLLIAVAALVVWTASVDGPSSRPSESASGSPRSLRTADSSLELPAPDEAWARGRSDSAAGSPSPTLEEDGESKDALWQLLPTWFVRGFEDQQASMLIESEAIRDVLVGPLNPDQVRALRAMRGHRLDLEGAAALRDYALDTDLQVMAASAAAVLASDPGPCGSVELASLVRGLLLSLREDPSPNRRNILSNVIRSSSEREVTPEFAIALGQLAELRPIDGATPGAASHSDEIVVVAQCARVVLVRAGRLESSELVALLDDPFEDVHEAVVELLLERSPTLLAEERAAIALWIRGAAKRRGRAGLSETEELLGVSVGVRDHIPVPAGSYSIPVQEAIQRIRLVHELRAGVGDGSIGGLRLLSLLQAAPAATDRAAVEALLASTATADELARLLGRLPVSQSREILMETEPDIWAGHEQALVLLAGGWLQASGDDIKGAVERVMVLLARSSDLGRLSLARLGGDGVSTDVRSAIAFEFALAAAEGGNSGFLMAFVASGCGFDEARADRLVAWLRTQDVALCGRILSATSGGAVSEFPTAYLLGRCSAAGAAGQAVSVDLLKDRRGSPGESDADIAVCAFVLARCVESSPASALRMLDLLPSPDRVPSENESLRHALHVLATRWSRD